MASFIILMLLLLISFSSKFAVGMDVGCSDLNCVWPWETIDKSGSFCNSDEGSCNLYLYRRSLLFAGERIRILWCSFLSREIFPYFYRAVLSSVWRVFSGLVCWILTILAPELWGSGRGLSSSSGYLLLIDPWLLLLAASCNWISFGLMAEKPLVVWFIPEFLWYLKFVILD